MLNGFAVIDFETTGLHAEGHDRVLEVGVVLLDSRGGVEGEFATLVNPNRDVGPTRIHGITARDILEAPTFENIAPELLSLLSQRMLVAHNMSFDSRFLAAELRRLGMANQVPQWPALCTMLLAGQIFPGAGRSLAACCEAAGISNDRPHEALSDALATAEFLRQMIDSKLDRDFIDMALSVEYPDELWPHLAPVRFRPLRRSESQNRQSPASYIATKVEMVLIETMTDAERQFLATLDRVLSDEVITPEESQELLDAAAAAQVSIERLQELRELYFQDLAIRVWEDGELSADEVRLLRRVAEIMRVDDETTSAALRRPAIENAAPMPVSEKSSLVLQPGDLVVLTGDMEQPRAYYIDLLQKMGLSVWPSVTKKVKLVIAADTASLSGKAKRAKELGTPVVSINDFLEMLPKD